MDRTSDQLKLELIKRNITIPSSGTGRGKALSRKDMVNLLAKHHYAKLEKPSWGLTQRLKYESPAVCFTFKNLKEEEKKHIQDSEDWVAETKWDGCRIWICYHPAEGFTFFSRNISVEDFLPVDYTDTILIIKDGKVSKPSDYIGRYKQSFILDSECVTDCKDLDTSLGLTKKGVITGTELNAVSALLALNPADSHQLQMTKAPSAG